MMRRRTSATSGDGRRRNAHGAITGHRDQAGKGRSGSASSRARRVAPGRQSVAGPAAMAMTKDRHAPTGRSGTANLHRPELLSQRHCRGLFQGNPCEEMAPAAIPPGGGPNPKARARMRHALALQIRRATPKPRAKNSASIAGRPTTPSGIAQAKRSASTRKARPSHHNPVRKKPNPQNHPATAAARMAPRRFPAPAPAAPSRSQTATLSETINAGKKSRRAAWPEPRPPQQRRQWPHAANPSSG